MSAKLVIKYKQIEVSRGYMNEQEIFYTHAVKVLDYTCMELTFW